MKDNKLYSKYKNILTKSDVNFFDALKGVGLYIKDGTIEDYDNSNIQKCGKEKCKGKCKECKKYKKAYYIYNESYYTKNFDEYFVKILKKEGIYVCPLCGLNDIINGYDDRKGISAQYDHIISRSEKPIFSGYIYNILPICGKCNNHKSQKDLENYIKICQEDKIFNFLEDGFDVKRDSLYYKPTLEEKEAEFKDLLNELKKELHLEQRYQNHLCPAKMQIEYETHLDSKNLELIKLGFDNKNLKDNMLIESIKKIHEHERKLKTHPGSKGRAPFHQLLLDNNL